MYDVCHVFSLTCACLQAKPLQMFISNKHVAKDYRNIASMNAFLHKTDVSFQKIREKNGLILSHRQL